MDWLLAAHQVAPLQYEMGGLWTPISVRDQMVRGQELARRAIVAGLISKERSLIVVGAGAGGMAAAITAYKAGVPVIVLERGTRPFARQAGVTSRTIHPYVYDWPHDRHRNTDLIPPAVLPWREATADGAAGQWNAALEAHRMIAFDSSVSPPPPPGGSAIAIHDGVANVHVTTPVGAGWLRGGMVLSSTTWVLRSAPVAGSAPPFDGLGTGGWIARREAPPGRGEIAVDTVMRALHFPGAMLTA